MLALKNLLRRKVRTAFALLGIAVGISAVVSIVSMARGLRTQFYRIAAQFAYDVIVQRKGVPSPMFSQLGEEDRRKVLGLPGVLGASTFTFHALREKDPTRPQPIITLGLEPGGELLRRYKILRGRTLEPGDERVLLVGELVAKQRGLDVGKKLECEDESYEVVGIFSPPVGGVNLLTGQAIANGPWLERAFQRQPSLIIAHLRLGEGAFEHPKESASVDAEVAAVLSAVATARGLRHVEAKPFKEYLDSFRQTEIVDKFAWGISFLAALVGGIGIANTMLMSVFERTREIGLLRAVGWSRSRIAALIVTEGLVLSIAGGLLGVPLGLLELELAASYVEMGWLQITLEPRLWAQAVALAALIGAAGSLYPGLRAASLEPTEALRYE